MLEQCCIHSKQSLNNVARLRQCIYGFRPKANDFSNSSRVDTFVDIALVATAVDTISMKKKNKQTKQKQIYSSVYCVI